jgi:hypothetical protein
MAIPSASGFRRGFVRFVAPTGPARPCLRERFVQHSDQRVSVVGVRLAFVQLYELLDLLANRDLLGHDHVATLRSRLEQRQLDRRCDFVRLLVLAAIREAILTPDAIGPGFYCRAAAAYYGHRGSL